MISWEKITKSEMDSIGRICNRTMKTLPDTDKMSLNMDISAVHVGGCRLDLDRLESFDDFNFLHDVCGIQRHINRATGDLMNCFLPRCSV